jgi:hypothetical protein
MRALRTLVSMRENLESPAARDEMTIEEKRSEFGLRGPTPIDADRWHVDAENQVLDYAHSFGLEAS